jgi:chromosomal replication initiation ATPase DnaA
LPDLVSRIRNCLVIGIKNPDDNLIFALLIKYLSDRQINIDKKLIEYIIKRIDRSYEKIFLFINKIDRLSLKKGKPINLATIKEALEK